MSKSLEVKVQELWNKGEITEIMYKFARSLDRVDGDLMKACYWEDAVEEHQDPIYPEQFFYNGNAHTFVPIAMKGFETLKVSHHRIANPIIELDGDTARAEAYVYAYHIHEEDGVDKEGILLGRHHFIFEKRDDVWKIKHRSTIFDSNQNQDGTAIWSENYSDKYRSKRNYTDDSYNYIEKEKKM